MDIILEQVEYRYAANSPFEKKAVEDVSFKIPEGQCTAIIGHTGSGKSTLLLHLNGLLKPTSGTVQIGDRTVKAGRKEKDLKPIREKVGIVFQFPEQQLFEETVMKDICYGPMNFGVSEAEAKKRAAFWLKEVGMPEEVLEKSPFDLSGGQMRRVAIAGVLAMEPEVLILDEPTAGLDPRGRREMMEMFYRLHKERGITLVLVTHSMEDAARYADKVVVMHKGRKVHEAPPRDLFSDTARLAKWGLGVPEVVKFQRMLEEKAGKPFPKVCLTMDELADMLKQGGDPL
ncbi:energy-coupling factor ABC transporter ATP-binding protein [Jeotgalibacillus haloalkalitolerans]|uniref:Energy-coupling factor transporter ATP-binding protein EcfA2 n=1 Tax=Jeotgalibacillus haloalkalitolerans TaxID=3104292 RepID=A0ABU5KRX5_9BACL|nr:energy-coupling factor ABC transporter ATP-binding protein [Jeotgalibacillus sp. HH7-29]MDZ5713696.1 energy-coupling factor ABC transporter ATP-binding protein [Jeotgalibacillus sp. HH7-29]